MSFQPSLVIPLVLGVVFLVFARTVTNFMSRLSPRTGTWFDTPLRRSLFFVWPIRGAGILCLVFVLMTATSGPIKVLLDRDRLLLLENGVVKQGKVKSVSYELRAPAGWTVVYEFAVKDPGTNEVKTYIGSTQGPKKYYHRLSQGWAITVIYDPSDPRLNCEIRCFLNHPSFRHTFKKAGKLYLLDRFRDRYEIESYTYDEWYGQQQGWEKR